MNRLSPPLGDHARDPLETPDPLETLEARLTETWGHLNAATCHFLELLAEFDRAEGWARHGMGNCAQWLNWQCGISACAAREKVRVARALESLPRIRAAFGEGRLSYSKVRAVTRVATRETEETLLNIALNGTASHVEKTVRLFRRAQRGEDRAEAEALHRERYLRWRYEEDGACVLTARLAPEVAALVKQAIEAVMEAEDAPVTEEVREVQEVREAEGGKPGWNVSAETGKDGSFAVAQGEGRLGSGDDAGTELTPESGVSAETSVRGAALPAAGPIDIDEAEAAETLLEQRRADALRLLAEGFLARKRETAVSGAGRYQVVVHIDQADLSAAGANNVGCADNVGCAEIEDGPSLAVATARRLACGGALVGIVEGDKGEPLSVGRKTRAVGPAIARALKARDRGCRFPGCDRSRFTQAHHVKHWADGGETKLGNLITLCYHHHHLVHEGGFGVRATGAGSFEFTSPAGELVAAAFELPKCFRGNTHGDDIRVNPRELPLAEWNARRGLAIDAATARCGWLGERMDYNLATEGLCWESGMR